MALGMALPPGVSAQQRDTVVGLVGELDNLVPGFSRLAVSGHVRAAALFVDLVRLNAEWQTQAAEAARKASVTASAIAEATSRDGVLQRVASTLVAGERTGEARAVAESIGTAWSRSRALAGPCCRARQSRECGSGEEGRGPG